MYKAVYLGDGLYIDFDGYQIRLFTSNGPVVTNQVFLDSNTLVAFQKYIEILKKGI